MAQAPHKPVNKPAEKHVEKDNDVKVEMPGKAPEVAPAHEEDREVSDLTKAEQETGRQTVKDAGERLKDEQEAGSRLIKKSGNDE